MLNGVMEYKLHDNRKRYCVGEKNEPSRKEGGHGAGQCERSNVKSNDTDMCMKCHDRTHYFVC